VREVEPDLNPIATTPFQTDRVPGLNIVLLFVGGKLVNLGVAL
jgi:hypothetical protein